jgi:hypothetical protein
MSGGGDDDVVCCFGLFSVALVEGLRLWTFCLSDAGCKNYVGLRIDFCIARFCLLAKSRSLETKKRREQLSCDISLDRGETTAVLGYQNISERKERRPTRKEERSTPAISHGSQPAVDHVHYVSLRAHNDACPPYRTYACARNPRLPAMVDQSLHRGMLPSNQSPCAGCEDVHDGALVMDVVDVPVDSRRSFAGDHAGTWALGLGRARGMCRAA